MNIGILDADLSNQRTKFPNLALMKISAAWKLKGHETELIGWEDCENFDKVYVSKVFSFTGVQQDKLDLPHVYYGGTGFFFDKAPKLPYEVEHTMPDYELYSGTDKKFKYCHKTSIGFTTRGCFRKCNFCVNRNETYVKAWSPVKEFDSSSNKRIVLLDDNILGYSKRVEILNTLQDTKKKFEFNQGIDVRLLNPEVAEILSEAKYSGDMIFAFDNWEQREEIVNKLKLWNEFRGRMNTKVYVLAGYKSVEKEDIIETFKRIKVLMSLRQHPYIMRYEGWDSGSMRGMYITLSRWCNQPSFFTKKSFREFVEAHKENSAPQRYAADFEKRFPEEAAEFFDLKYEEIEQI